MFCMASASRIDRLFLVSSIQWLSAAVVWNLCQLFLVLWKAKRKQGIKDKYQDTPLDMLRGKTM